jgi:hypothetical protein
MPYTALRDREGRPYITFIDDKIPEEEEEADTSLAQNSEIGKMSEEDPEISTIEPLSAGPKQEHFIFAHPRDARSIMSMPPPLSPDSDLDPLIPEDDTSRWRRQNKISSYREFTWPVINSRNVMQTRDPETLHLEKQHRDTKRMSDRHYLQKTGRSDYAQY